MSTHLLLPPPRPALALFDAHSPKTLQLFPTLWDMWERMRMKMMMLMRIEDEDEGEDKDEDDDEPAQCGGRSTVSKMLCIFQLCPCSGGRAGLPWLLLPSADSHLFLCSLKLCSFFTAALCPTLARSRQGLHFTYSISERHCRLGRALRQSSNFY